MSHDVILINFQVEFMIARGKDDKDKVLARLLALSHIIYVEMCGLNRLQRSLSISSVEVDLRVIRRHCEVRFHQLGEKPPWMLKLKVFLQLPKASERLNIS
jgi:hypothetical protein